MLGAALGGLAVVALIGVLLVGLLNQERSDSIVEAIAADERPAAPELELPVLIPGAGFREGEVVRISELRGTPLVLNFWASWCPPCRTEAPVLEEIWQTYRGRGLLVLGVNVRDLSGNAQEFDREFGLSYPSLRDGDDSSERAYQVPGLPETFVIDRQGRITAKRAGEVTSVEQLAAPIESVL
jgi:cytochrome c biogenesis protein CcmG/thiol:disulfide interchange protein DsbE